MGEHGGQGLVPEVSGVLSLAYGGWEATLPPAPEKAMTDWHVGTTTQPIALRQSNAVGQLLLPGP